MRFCIEPQGFICGRVSKCGIPPTSCFAVLKTVCRFTLFFFKNGFLQLKMWLVTMCGFSKKCIKNRTQLFTIHSLKIEVRCVSNNALRKKLFWLFYINRKTHFLLQHSKIGAVFTSLVRYSSFFNNVNEFRVRYGSTVVHAVFII